MDARMLKPNPCGIYGTNKPSIKLSNHNETRVNWYKLVYLPQIWVKLMVNIGKYTIHGSYLGNSL